MRTILIMFADIYAVCVACVYLFSHSIGESLRLRGQLTNAAGVRQPLTAAFHNDTADGLYQKGFFQSCGLTLCVI